MGMTKIGMLADLSGWLVRSGYLALKVVSNSGETTNSSCSRFPHRITWIRNILAEEITQQHRQRLVFSFPSTSQMGDL